MGSRGEGRAVRCGTSAGPGQAPRAGLDGSSAGPADVAGGDQSGDGGVDFGVGLTTAEVALVRPPLRLFADGVLHADPCRGLSAAPFTPGLFLARRRFVLRLLRRGADLVGEVVGQASAALIGLGPGSRVQPHLLGDVLATLCGPVVHPVGPVGSGSQQTPRDVTDGGGRGGVLLRLAGDERSDPACRLSRTLDGRIREARCWTSRVSAARRSAAAIRISVAGGLICP